MAAKVASSGRPGMEPRVGGPVPGDNKDCRMLHYVGGSFSSLLLWHMVRLGCFSAQLCLYSGLEWKAVFSTLFQPKSGIRRAHPGSDACLPGGPSLGPFGKLGGRALAAASTLRTELGP